MLETDRHNRILDLLRSDENCSVKTLAQQLYVSEATIRRDLHALDQQGLVKRVYGGAVLIEGHSNDLPRNVRELQQQKAKQVVSRKAAQLVRDGMSIYLDASTTTQAMCEHLQPFKGITVITNGLRTAEILGTQNIRTFCTGGMLLYNSLAYVGSYAEGMLREFHPDICFFSTSGINDEGVMTDRCAEEAAIIKVMMEQSARQYYLCDSSKFGNTYCYRVTSASRVTDIISNAQLPAGIQAQLRAPQDYAHGGDALPDIDEELDL